MQELIEKVEQWAIDKGIDIAENWKPQFKKDCRRSDGV